MNDSNFIISATDKTKAAFGSVEKGLHGIGDKVFSVQSAVAGLAGAGGFGALVKMSADSADALAKVSDRTGDTTQKLAGLQYAAGLASDVTGEVMVQSLEKMNRKIAEAAIKGGEGADAINRLGLNVQDLAAMSAGEQFETISEGMRGVSNQGERAYIAQKLMEEQGVKLLNTMMLGKDGLADYTREAEAFGIAVDKVQAAKIVEANDQLSRAGMAVKGIGTTVAVELAPYVSAIAQHFADAARESDGFKAQAISGVEAVANGVAYLSDIWRGLSVVWGILETSFYAFVAGSLTYLQQLDNGVSAFIDKIPGLEAKPSAALAEWATDARQRVIDAQVSLADLAMQPMPSDGIKQFFAEVRAEAEASAQKMAANSSGLNNNRNFGFNVDDGKARDQLAEKLAKLDESLLAENERLALHYVDQQFLVEEAFQRDLLNDSERQIRLEQLEAQHQQKMNAIAYSGMAAHEKFATAFRRNDVRNSLAFGAELTAGVAQQNRVMFGINKAFALANAGVALPDAVMQSFRNGGGYPWGLIPAGLMLTTGLGQIAAIAGTSFGGGGSAPSLAGAGGGGSTVNTVPIASTGTSSAQSPLPSPTNREPTRRVEINLRGSGMVSHEWIRDELLPSINEAVGDGVDIRANS